MNPHTHCLRSLCAFLAALVLAACLACPALADAPLVRDEYGLFDADTLAQLESSAEDASAGHDCDVYFLTVDSIGDTDQRAYAKNYYVQNDLGSGSGKSGILFMIALGSRKYVTITYGGGVTAFTDYRIEQLEDEVVPLLSTATTPMLPRPTSTSAPARWTSTPRTASRWITTTTRTAASA